MRGCAGINNIMMPGVRHVVELQLGMMEWCAVAPVTVQYIEVVAVSCFQAGFQTAMRMIQWSEDGVPGLVSPSAQEIMIPICSVESQVSGGNISMCRACRL